jgi:DNA-binding MarR family transcriptional regulator
VLRRAHPDDRHTTLIELTERGQTAFAASSSVFERSLGELISVLSEEQREELLRCLDVLLAELQRRAGPVEPPSAA